MTRRYDVWDHRTRWKRGCNKAPNIQDHFHQLETLKVSSPSVPCLETIGKKSSWETLTNNDKNLNSNPRKVLMQITKGNNGRTLAKSNSLPPIYSLGVGCQEQNVEKKANVVRMNKALFNRQKQGCLLTSTSQLISSELSVFIKKEPDTDERQDNLKIPVAPVEPSYLSANDRERAEVSKGRCAQPLSDSTIEMDSLSSQKKENEEERTGFTNGQEKEYYTDQMITAWIIKVNEILFSSKEDITDQALEEQDVDTIKIIYGQD